MKSILFILIITLTALNLSAIEKPMTHITGAEACDLFKAVEKPEITSDQPWAIEDDGSREGSVTKEDNSGNKCELEFTIDSNQVEAWHISSARGTTLTCKKTSGENGKCRCDFYPEQIATSCIFEFLTGSTVKINKHPGKSQWTNKNIGKVSADVYLEKEWDMWIYELTWYGRRYN